MAGKVWLAALVLSLAPMPAAADPPTAVTDPDGSAVALSDDGRFVVVGDREALRVWDRRTGTAVRVTGSRAGSGAGFGGMTASGRRVLVVESGRTISRLHLAMWDRRTRRTTVISKNLGEVLATTLSPDGRYVGFSRRVRDAGKVDNEAWLFDRRTRRMTLLAKGSVFGYLISLSRDAGLVVVSDLGDEHTFAYEPATGKRTVLTVNSSRGLSLASPDGDFALVSTDEALSGDDTDRSSDVYLWDRATGDFLLVAGDLAGPVLGAGVSDGGEVVTLYTDVLKSILGRLQRWRAVDGVTSEVAPQAVPALFSDVPTLSRTGAYVVYTAYRQGGFVAGPLP